MNYLERIVEKYHDKPWDWETLTIDTVPVLTFRNNFLKEKDACISLKFIETHPNYPWSWRVMSHRNDLTIEFIEEHIDKDWDWSYLSRWQNLSMEFVEKHIDKKWNWRYISRNPNMTLQFVNNHPEKILWGELSFNTFSKTIKRDNAATKIQKAWKHYWYGFTQIEPVSGMPANRHALYNLKEMDKIVG